MIWSSASGNFASTRYSCGWRGLANGSTKPPTLAFCRMRQDVLERHVAVVRALVIAPAHMQPHPVARHVDDRLVDRLDDPLDEAEEIAERPVVVGQVALEREVGAVELQQEAVLDDRLVFDLQRRGDRREIGARSCRNTRSSSRRR